VIDIEEILISEPTAKNVLFSTISLRALLLPSSHRSGSIRIVCFFIFGSATQIEVTRTATQK
jgi:hypothetical protein